MTCREAIHDVFPDDGTILTTNEVVQRVYAHHPGATWTRGTIGTYLIGLSVNHSSGHHYPSLQRHAFLYSLGNGRYRRWDRARDGESPQPAAARRSEQAPAFLRRSKGAAQTGAVAERAPRTRPGRSRTEEDWRRARAAVDEEARAELVRQLAHDIEAEPFQPRYRREPYGKPVTGWRARYLSYFWPRPSMDVKATV
ncbi:MAG: hypothetical protein U5K81_14110, partial [Trueperaceae bacterium]|nr:hypothetical protein [Trueperaceae bacterium]